MQLTPFQFSSNKLQYTNSVGTGMQPSGNTSNTGLLGDAAQTVMSWHEMWVNPSQVKTTTPYIQSTQHTAGSIVTFHYRPDLTQLSVSGFVGWVAIQSDIEAMQSGMFGLLRGDTAGLKNSVTGATDSITSGLKLQNNQRTGDDLTKGSRINKLNNSPRKFIKRLKDLADEPMYYLDSDGREHYNIKYIKMFTKQFPNGIICEGFFKVFEVPESADDAQTIQYQFEFIVENMKPVTLLQRVAGMFSGIGSVAGGAAGLF